MPGGDTIGTHDLPGIVFLVADGIHMRRAAAIIGPTPAFVRWAIKHPCQLREIDEERLPATTFRQLRSIHELDLARRENRIFKEVAFHADTQLGHELFGFLPAEILAASGGASKINNACSNCVANTQAEVNGWVGCFGIVRIESSGFVEDFEAAIDQLELGDELEANFVSTKPRWFGVWMDGVFQRNQLRLLLDVLESLSLSSEWELFRKAVQLCQDNQLELHAEYFPAGVSDGQHWRWDAHCDRCRAPVNSTTICECCGRKKVEQVAKKRKVLGLRPYMKLLYVLGEQKCEQLVREYVDWKVRTSSDT